MTVSEHINVDGSQFLVQAAGPLGDMRMFTVGDRLVQVVGECDLTVITGPITGRVPVRVTLGRPGPRALDGWDAASEATLFNAGGSLAVGELTGRFPEALSALAVPAGLVRVRVQVRNRCPEGYPTDPDRPEEYHLYVWPVAHAAEVMTLRDDQQGIDSTPSPEYAATWAVRRLLSAANPTATEAALRRMSGEQPWRYPRVEIRRQSGAFDVERFGLTPDGDDLVLPVGDVEIRLRPTPARPGSFAATVRWATRPGATVAVPDLEPSTVELSAAGLTHRGVRAEDAVQLGLVWEYLLQRAGTERGHPWDPVFAAVAAEAARRAAATRRSRQALEIGRWGGRMPSPRIRTLQANTHMLWDLDPDVVEALADATPDAQRAVARWAARRACAVAGLDTVGWIAVALAAVERNEPLPPGLDDQAGAFNRLLSDPGAPSTVVRAPDGRPNWSQQALAFPALLAAANGDPLAAAVEALGAAAWAHGDEHPRFLATARAEFGFLNRGGNRG